MFTRRCNGAMDPNSQYIYMEKPAPNFVAQQLVATITIRTSSMTENTFQGRKHGLIVPFCLPIVCVCWQVCFFVGDSPLCLSFIYADLEEENIHRPDGLVV